MTIKKMNKRKGIVLAGGSGTRLNPITFGVSKQLLPIYDKPMIYYPLSILMLAKIKDILLISTSEDIDNYKKLLGNGEQFGFSITYEIQDKPNGLAEAFLIGEKFIGDDQVALILGDNIFYGQGFSKMLNEASKKNDRASVFGCYVKDPERFGVAEFDINHKIISIEEKPLKAKSNYAITGLYFYDNSVISKAKSLVPSERGELEISDINNLYIKEERLDIKLLGRGFSWLDTGTCESLFEAGQFVKNAQKGRGLKIACLEEISYRNGWISKEKLLLQAEKNSKTDYGKYLTDIAESLEI